MWLTYFIHYVTIYNVIYFIKYYELEGVETMKIITIGTLKGGVGKSSFVFNLAGILAEEGKKVLLIDTDPQTNLSLNCGVDVTASKLKTLKDIFDTEPKAEQVTIKSPIKKLPGIDIIPSSILLTATELQIVSRAGRENILQNYFYDNSDFLTGYDYILIDTNPSMNIINQNAFVVADSIVLVSDVSLNGIQGAELFLALWGNTRQQLRKSDNVKALVLNNLDKRIKLSQELIDFAKGNEGINNLLLENYISNSVKYKETEIEHLPINLLHQQTPAHLAYLNIAKELKERDVL